MQDQNSLKALRNSTKTHRETFEKVVKKVDLIRVDGHFSGKMCRFYFCKHSLILGKPRIVISLYERNG